jgi:hypothetical protein
MVSILWIDAQFHTLNFSVPTIPNLRGIDAKALFHAPEVKGVHARGQKQER